MDLENARKLTDMVNWLVKYGDMDIDKVRALPIKDIRKLMDTVKERLTVGLALPKANGERSSSP